MNSIQFEFRNKISIRAPSGCFHRNSLMFKNGDWGLFFLGTKPCAEGNRPLLFWGQPSSAVVSVLGPFSWTAWHLPYTSNVSPGKSHLHVGWRATKWHALRGWNGEWVIFSPLLEIFHLPLVRIEMGRAGQYRDPEWTRSHMGKKWPLRGPRKREIKGSLNNSHLDQRVSCCLPHRTLGKQTSINYAFISLPCPTHNFQHSYLANGWMGSSLLAERFPAYQITVCANP